MDSEMMVAAYGRANEVPKELWNREEGATRKIVYRNVFIHRTVKFSDRYGPL